MVSSMPPALLSLFDMAPRPRDNIKGFCGTDIGSTNWRQRYVYLLEMVVTITGTAARQQPKSTEPYHHFCLICVLPRGDEAPSSPLS